MDNSETVEAEAANLIWGFLECRGFTGEEAIVIVAKFLQKGVRILEPDELDKIRPQVLPLLSDMISQLIENG